MSVVLSEANYKVAATVADDGSDYFLTANTFTILDTNNDECGVLVGMYTVPMNPLPSQDNPFRLAAVINQVTYIRGSPLSNAFGTADTVVAAKGTKN
ncbi:Aste57867_10694 [Aphanomyces stellatus]|uniref:Aste57867_10694 protein n=1 Tax=Aphanomyces stellatus TaxID=120398 RepID=A0A485KRG7_9STRA|nr:hypothetical protein As57867_010654 [Aphanomyces stellatus]VFT87564.1 Aste57867_10694 [Aphanomyces stellatus]